MVNACNLDVLSLLRNREIAFHFSNLRSSYSYVFRGRDQSYTPSLRACTLSMTASRPPMYHPSIHSPSDRPFPSYALLPLQKGPQSAQSGQSTQVGKDIKPPAPCPRVPPPAPRENQSCFEEQNAKSLVFGFLVKEEEKNKAVLSVAQKVISNP